MTRRAKLARTIENRRNEAFLGPEQGAARFPGQVNEIVLLSYDGSNSFTNRAAAPVRSGPIEIVSSDDDKDALQPTLGRSARKRPRPWPKPQGPIDLCTPSPEPQNCSDIELLNVSSPELKSQNFPGQDGGADCDFPSTSIDDNIVAPPHLSADPIETQEMVTTRSSPSTPKTSRRGYATSGSSSLTPQSAIRSASRPSSTPPAQNTSFRYSVSSKKQDPFPNPLGSASKPISRALHNSPHPPLDRSNSTLIITPSKAYIGSKIIINDNFGPFQAHSPSKPSSQLLKSPSPSTSRLTHSPSIKQPPTSRKSVGTSASLEETADAEARSRSRSRSQARSIAPVDGPLPASSRSFSVEVNPSKDDCRLKKDKGKGKQKETSPVTNSKPARSEKRKASHAHSPPTRDPPSKRRNTRHRATSAGSASQSSHGDGVPKASALGLDFPQEQQQENCSNGSPPPSGVGDAIVAPLHIPRRLNEKAEDWFERMRAARLAAAPRKEEDEAVPDSEDEEEEEALPDIGDLSAQVPKKPKKQRRSPTPIEEQELDAREINRMANEYLDKFEASTGVKGGTGRGGRNNFMAGLAKREKDRKLHGWKSSKDINALLAAQGDGDGEGDLERLKASLMDDSSNKPKMSRKEMTELRARINNMPNLDAEAKQVLLQDAGLERNGMENARDELMERDRQSRQFWEGSKPMPSSVCLLSKFCKAILTLT